MCLCSSTPLPQTLILLYPCVWPLQPKPDMERHAALVRPDFKAKPAPRWSPPVEEEWCGPRVQPPVWVRRAGRWGHGENGQGLENRTGAFPLCCWIHPGTPVSSISTSFVAFATHCIICTWLNICFLTIFSKKLQGKPSRALEILI